MKNTINTIKKGFLMLTILVTSLSFANEDASIIIKNDADKTSLTLKDVKPGNVLSIKDENGMTLYKESIKTAGDYTKGFDLTELPNGTYTFEVNKDVKISSIPFTVAPEGVSINKEDEKVFFKPITRVEGNLLYVTKLSLDESPLTIDIYDESTSSSEPIHSETIENSKVIERVYELKNLEYGNFEIVYHTDGRIFSKSIH